MVHKRFFACMAAVCIIFCGLSASGLADETAFPEYTVVKPNVSFWINIYSRYATTQAVVHDCMDLDIVYDVIDLEPADTPGAVQTNRERMKAATKQYAQTLQLLAADPSNPNADCRRVAALFAPGAQADVFETASRQVRCQVGQQDRFREGLVRSGAYIDQIRNIFQSYALPEDLAYLPHVESSFDIMAYSKYGAAGMWQFTRSTGKRFLTVSHILDERRDPIAATHAAAQLLKENYEKLGTWPLAITAYNHGAAGMERAKAMHGDYPQIFSDYNGRTFKFASRNFYSEFLAARKIASDHQRYFGQLDLAGPVSTRSARLEGFVAFDELCRHFGVDPEMVRALNPALGQPVIGGQKLIPKHYRLNLPGIEGVRNGVSLANLLPDIYQHAQTPSRFYTVQLGDTAGKIARMHRVRVEDLVMANNLNHHATVYVHQRLRIPRSDGSPADQDTGPVLITAKPEIAKVSADTLQTTPPPLMSNPMENGGIADQCTLSLADDLLAMADGEDLPLLPNEVALEPEPSPTVVNANVAFTHVEKTQRQPVGMINVEVEETIGHYAEWAGVRASRIRSLNNIPLDKPLQLHQPIQIPLDKVAAETFEARRLSFHEQLQKDFFAAYRVEELQQYRVKPGDSYWTICHKKFDLPLWLLRHYNKDVNLAALQADQPLIIPAIQSIVHNPSIGFDRSAVPDA